MIIIDERTNKIVHPFPLFDSIVQELHASIEKLYPTCNNYSIQDVHGTVIGGKVGKPSEKITFTLLEHFRVFMWNPEAEAIYFGRPYSRLNLVL